MSTAPRGQIEGGLVRWCPPGEVRLCAGCGLCQPLPRLDMLTVAGLGRDTWRKGRMMVSGRQVRI